MFEILRTVYFLFYLFLFFYFFSCKKEDQKLVITDSLIGSWELRSSFNGLTGQHQDYPEGNGNILIFDGLNYKIYSNGELINNGAYKVIREKSVVTKKEVYKLIYDGEFDAIKNVVDVTGDKLTYAVDAFDGSISIYKRK